jgi:SAM-dependent methyltransferase
VDPFSTHAVRSAYDVTADDYAIAFGDELWSLPLDREMLQHAIELCGAGGLILEVGSGPAPASAFVAGIDHDVDRQPVALDLSHRMLTVARERNPRLPAAQADIRRLPLADCCCSLVIAFYVLQHLPRSDLGEAISEFRRVLTLSGLLLLATHLGDRDVVSDVFLGHHIETVAAALHDRNALAQLLDDAGFNIEIERQRAPVAGEFDSQRLYLLARLR